MEQGVWLEAYPFHEGYTWGLLDFTLRLVEKEVRARGMCMYEWELERVEGGRTVRLWGRGRMWLALVGGWGGGLRSRIMLGGGGGFIGLQGYGIHCDGVGEP